MFDLYHRIRRHITNPDSHHRQIASKFLLVSFFVLVGKLAGAAKEMAIAWRYGISEIVDAYVLVFSLVTWPVSVCFGILSVVLVPLMARVKTNNAVDIQQFRNELLALSIILGVALSLLVYFIFPYILQGQWTGLSDSTKNIALNFNSGLAPIAFLGIIINLFSVLMLANGNHRNTLFEAIPALVILIALFAPQTLITEPLLWGTLVGILFQLIALSVPLIKKHQLGIPQLSLHSPAWQGFWSAIGVLAISQTLMTLTVIIDQFTAANLGVGAISTLSYSNRILALLSSLGAMAISRAILPVFSDMRAKQQTDLARTALLWCSWMFLLGTFVLIVVWFFSPWIVSVLFEHGQFSEADSKKVTEVLRWGIVQIPFFFCGLVLVQLLATHERYNVIAFFALTNLLVKVIGNLILPELMGVSGVALATALMYVWSTACLFIVVRRTI